MVTTSDLDIRYSIFLTSFPHIFGIFVNKTKENKHELGDNWMWNPFSLVYNEIALCKSTVLFRFNLIIIVTIWPCFSFLFRFPLDSIQVKSIYDDLLMLLRFDNWICWERKTMNSFCFAHQFYWIKLCKRIIEWNDGNWSENSLTST